MVQIWPPRCWFAWALGRALPVSCCFQFAIDCGLVSLQQSRLSDELLIPFPTLTRSCIGDNFAWPTDLQQRLGEGQWHLNAWVRKSKLVEAGSLEECSATFRSDIFVRKLVCEQGGEQCRMGGVAVHHGKCVYHCMPMLSKSHLGYDAC